MNTQSKFVRSLLMLLAAMLLAATGASAQDDTSIMDQLNLSQTQRDQITKLRKDFLRNTEGLRADIKRLLAEERALKNTNPPNVTALRAKLKERADKEIELSIALTRFNEQLQAILTPEQRKLMGKLQTERQRPREQ